MKYTMIALICFGLMGCVTTDNVIGTKRSWFPKDVLSGNWIFKDTLDQNLKKWGYAIVNKSDGHPVRSGEQSMRFEVRAGDCSWSRNVSSTTTKAEALNDIWRGTGFSDCVMYRERREKKQDPGDERGENWYHYSLYIPEDFPVIYPVITSLGQWHAGYEDGRYASYRMDLTAGGMYTVNYAITGEPDRDKGIIHLRDMRGKWTDVLMHANWSRDDDGFFRVYLNGDSTPVYEWSGITRKKGPSRIHFKFGIYRFYIYKRNIYIKKMDKIEIPTQIVYYDDVRKGKSCEEVTSYFDCDRIVGK